MTPEQELKALTDNVGSALRDAYDTGYTHGTRTTREEIIAKIESRRKVVEGLGRDTTEILVMLTIIKADRLES
jgi:hypothetical protein